MFNSAWEGDEWISKNRDVKWAWHNDGDRSDWELFEYMIISEGESCTKALYCPSIGAYLMLLDACRAGAPDNTFEAIYKEGRREASGQLLMF